MNPFKILNVSIDASQREIIQAVTKAMRERKHSSHDIAIAQKELLSPISRAVHQFVHFITIDSLQKKPKRKFPEMPETHTFKRLTIFDRSV